MTFTRDEFKHGLRCAECDEKFVEGSPYSKRLDAVIEIEHEPHVVTEIVCVPCGLGVAR